MITTANPVFAQKSNTPPQDDIYLFPTSFGQRRLWFLQQLDPHNAYYNSYMVIRFTEHLNEHALARSLQEMVNRHEILRTTFALIDNEPMQVVTLNEALLANYAHWRFYDFSHGSVVEQEQQIHELIKQEIQQPFDLITGPLMRSHLLKLNHETHLLFLTWHHIITDAWSTAIFFQELATLYTAFKQGQASPLAELPIQYGDFALWQRQWLADERMSGQLEYWRRQLIDLPPLLPLALDYPRPAIDRFQGGNVHFRLSVSLLQKLKQLGKETDTTLFMTLLAAFKVLLLRYTGQKDMVVGTPIANRGRTELESLIGFFLNTLVLRTNLASDSSGCSPTFREILKRVQQVTLNSYRYQDAPFEKVVEELQPHRSLSYSPLFQVMFVLQNAPTISEFPTIRLEQLFNEVTSAKFDLTLMMFETSEGMEGVLNYNRALFDQTTIARMVGHFQTLLAGIAANPNQRICDLPMLSAAERHQLLVAWNDTATDYPITKTIHQLFEEQVKRTPDTVAVVMAEMPRLETGKQNFVAEEAPIASRQSLTYAELNDRADQLARHLQALGVGPDMLVGICVERSLEMMIGLLAILKAGGAYLPLDPAYPQERLDFMLKDAAPAVVVTQAHHRERFRTANTLILFDEEQGAELTIHSAAPVRSGGGCAVSSANLAYMIYTSGSTGQPKGVLLEHRGLVNLAQAQIRAFNVQPGDRVLQVASLNFDASISEIVMALCAGATLVMAPSEHLLPGFSLTQTIQAQNISHITLVPSALALLNPDEVPALQTVVVAGEACPASLATRWIASHRLLNAYGPTETTVCATIMNCTHWRNHQQAPPIGRPLANTQIYILDAQNQLVPIGVTGQLCIGGIGLARGYHHRLELTNEKFVQNPFGAGRLYKTGDLARWLPDGTIEYIGRIDQQVKLRGFRIELGEIEAALSHHPAVQEVAVIARGEQQASGREEKQLVAYVALAASSHRQNETGVLQPATLRSYLQSKLPEYMIPSVWVSLDSLPLTPSGKVDRKALPMPDYIHQTTAQPYRAPRNLQEWQMVQIWEAVLARSPIGIDDNFFELGGHSLLAVQLMARIQQVFGQSLPLKLLFQNATVQALVQTLVVALEIPASVNHWTPLVTIQPQGDKPPFFCLPGASGNPLYLYALTRHLGLAQPFYSFQAVGLDGVTAPATTVEAAATHYLTEIQSVQPCGPYHLGGHSYGGLVAFEMAQRLMQQGEVVATLAIFDAVAPKQWQKNQAKRTNDEVALMLAWANEISQFSGRGHELTADSLTSLRSEERLQALHARFIAAQILPADASLAVTRGLWQVFRTNATVTYHPQAVQPLPITLFVALDNLATARQKLVAGWQDYGPVNVKEVPGTHITMLVEPHVQELAKALAKLLAAATLTR